MMFYLHRLTEEFKGFNVFYYVTFRAVLAAITAFAISLLFGNYIIRKLISLKIGQPIRNASEVRQLAALAAPTPGVSERRRRRGRGRFAARSARERRRAEAGAE